MGQDVSGPNQAAALDLAIAAFPECLIRDARICAIPAYMDGAPEEGTWIQYTLRVRDDHDYVRGWWQADISSGVLREQSRRRGWASVAGQSILLNLPDGSERLDSARTLDSAFEGTIEHWSEAEIHGSVARAAAEAGCSIKSISFPRPLGFVAVDALLVRNDADACSRAMDEAFSTMLSTLLAGPARVEGVLLIVEDADGATVLRRGASVRLSSTVRTAF